MRHLRRTKCEAIGLLATIIVVVLQGLSFAAEPAAQVRERLAAGEFGPALSIAHAVGDPAARDPLLGEIAAAQAEAGGRRAALDTVAEISSDLARKAALGSMAASGDQGSVQSTQGSEQKRGARGG